MWGQGCGAMPHHRILKLVLTEEVDQTTTTRKARFSLGVAAPDAIPRKIGADHSNCVCDRSGGVWLVNARIGVPWRRPVPQPSAWCRPARATAACPVQARRTLLLSPPAAHARGDYRYLE